MNKKERKNYLREKYSYPFRKYRWTDKFNRPYESLWSIWQNFCLVNVFKESESLTILLDAVQRRKLSFNYSMGIFSNIYARDIILDKLKISKKHFLYFNTYKYNSINEIKYFISDFIRICPVCMSKHRYHSFLHQMKEMRCCLWHDLDLIDTNIKYSLTPSSKYAFNSIDITELHNNSFLLPGEREEDIFPYIIDDLTDDTIYNKAIIPSTVFKTTETMIDHQIIARFNTKTSARLLKETIINIHSFLNLTHSSMIPIEAVYNNLCIAVLMYEYRVKRDETIKKKIFEYLYGSQFENDLIDNRNLLYSRRTGLNLNINLKQIKIDLQTLEKVESEDTLLLIELILIRNLCQSISTSILPEYIIKKTQKNIIIKKERGLKYHAI